MSSGRGFTIGSISTDPLSTEVHWKIRHFYALTKINNYIGHSPPFQLQGQDWRLDLYVATFPSGYILFGLSRKGPSVVVPKQTVKCQFGVKHNHLIESKEFSMEQESPEWQFRVPLSGFSSSALEGETNALLPGGLLTFFCRLSIEGKYESTTKEASTQTMVNIADNVLATLSQNLKDLYVDKKQCDVTIKVKDETFSAHRAILGARTPVLEAMFSHDMTEAETGVICVEDCDSKAFEVFLMFVYSGTVDNLTSENVIPVYYIADKYDVPQLKEECVQCMVSNLAVDTICDVVSLAARHGEKVLLDEATDFFEENAQEIFLKPQWKRFMVENADVANELIILSLKYATTK